VSDVEVAIEQLARDYTLPEGWDSGSPTATDPAKPVVDARLLADLLLGGSIVRPCLPSWKH